MLGKQIAHYRIEEKLGEGGMGEVYRARDTRLNRDVALKILPQVFAQDAQRMARFEREAQVLASLNHANIAQIHGIEDVPGPESRVPSPTPNTAHPIPLGTKCLVLELVPGETLQEQIARGPIPVDEALKIALQICEGLEAAHEKGIIHRDLKPANIKITPEGQVKILDFGLAKALEGETPVADLSHSPTLTHQSTQAGVILGTAAYMSPEQARGKPLDKRTDIWAFGCVLFEMLTGKKAFGGDNSDETVSEVLAAVIKSEPKWETLTEETPIVVRRLLRLSLTKEARNRLRDINDVRIELREALQEDFDILPSVHHSRGLVIPLLTCAVITSVITAGIFLLFEDPSVPTSTRQVVKATIELPETAPVYHDYPAWPSLALSPDGRQLVYVAAVGGRTQLYIHSLDSSEFTPIAGTRDAVYAFFSPDGKQIAFYADYKLKTIFLDNPGMPHTVCDAIGSFGGTWTTGGSIIFPSWEVWSLAQVDPSEGYVKNVDHTSAAVAFPELLPGEEKVMVSTESSLSIISLDGSSQTDLPLPGITWDVGLPRYLSSGHLVYAQSDRLMAAPFSLDRLETTGPPKAVLNQLRAQYRGAAHYSVSDNGTLAYISGGAWSRGSLVWVDQQGHVEKLEGFQEAEYQTPRLSPDGRRIAVTIRDTRMDVHILDLQRGTMERFTDQGNNLSPVWSPDGRRIAFSSDRAGFWNIYSKPVEGTTKATQLTDEESMHIPNSWYGDRIAYKAYDRKTSWDIGLLVLPEKRTEWITRTTANEMGPEFSPDGSHVAYFSNEESGEVQVYVRSLLDQDKRWLISMDEGGAPVWDPISGELFYRNATNQTWYKVPYEMKPEFKPGLPLSLFSMEGFVPTHGLSYDYHPTNKRFLVIKTANSQKSSKKINLVLNWFEELKRLVPTE